MTGSGDIVFGVKVYERVQPSSTGVNLVLSGGREFCRKAEIRAFHLDQMKTGPGTGPDSLRRAFRHRRGACRRRAAAEEKGESDESARLRTYRERGLRNRPGDLEHGEGRPPRRRRGPAPGAGPGAAPHRHGGDVRRRQGGGAGGGGDRGPAGRGLPGQQGAAGERLPAGHGRGLRALPEAARHGPPGLLSPALAGLAPVGGHPRRVRGAARGGQDPLLGREQLRRGRSSPRPSASRARGRSPATRSSTISRRGPSSTP